MTKFEAYIKLLEDSTPVARKQLMDSGLNDEIINALVTYSMIKSNALKADLTDEQLGKYVRTILSIKATPID